ncbi:hypothetical protein PVAP13_7NG420300 [Panicum virgatum]|uniref:Uncharacterized protein n=1 Tax=Panicum virgatum TaxID=38727 RepID=A0A8T0Q966_PANVG|nr:hypothetical protein PVAP13_7NG420300 [Panicum virgatum]
MEGTRRAAAACCVLLIVLVSGHHHQQQQQVAAMTKFCRCYNKCYADCRTTRGPYPCNFECLQDCINGQPPASPADCNIVCLIRVCGVMETAMGAPGDAEACLSACTKKLGGAFEPSAAKTN